MERTKLIRERSSIHPGMREVQARWTPETRRERAQAGRRRMQEFLDLVATSDWSSSPASDDDLWAVGALGDDDWQRLVKRCG